MLATEGDGCRPKASFGHSLINVTEFFLNDNKKNGIGYDFLGSHPVARASQRSGKTLTILDSKCRVLFISRDSQTESEKPTALVDTDGHLREEFREIVAKLITRCERLSEQYAIAFIDDLQFVRVMVLEGNDGRSYALTIENSRRNSLERAARRYALTAREMQVLAFILEGAIASEVAASLHIAETTVQSYYKRLLQKTKSRNRPSMVANVCDWEGTRTRRARLV